MSSTYIWSDLHLGHQNIIKYCNRPFSTTDEMNNKILSNWKNMVKDKDEIWNLGDVAMCEMKKVENLKPIITSMPGHKILILGNHDYTDLNYWKEVGFHEVYKYPIIYNKWFILSHDIVFLNEHIPYKNIHGHTHDKSMDSPQYVNVSLEKINYQPVDLDKLMIDILI